MDRNSGGVVRTDLPIDKGSSGKPIPFGTFGRSGPRNEFLSEAVRNYNHLHLSQKIISIQHLPDSSEYCPCFTFADITNSV